MQLQKVEGNIAGKIENKGGNFSKHYIGGGWRKPKILWNIPTCLTQKLQKLCSY